MVWLAPVSLSSPGLSAVTSRRGTPDREASTTDGSRLATAVPELQSAVKQETYCSEGGVAFVELRKERFSRQGGLYHRRQQAGSAVPELQRAEKQVVVRIF
jgi:hypothetical protein